MSLTSGLASGVGLYWVRKRVKEQLNRGSGRDQQLFSRVRQRSKFGIAALAFTGCATVVSGGIDSIERAFGFEHRSAGHSIPVLGGLYTAAELALRAGGKAIRWVLNHLEYDGKFDAILRELKALAKWVLNGGMAGAVTHILGDLPTMGDGGFAALKLFYPISRRGFNLRLVKAGSRLFNTVTTYIGAFITATAWVGIGAHLVAPSLPEASFKTLCSKVGSLAWKAITRGATSLRETAMDALARMKNVLTDAWKTTGTSLSSLYHRTRVRLQHLLDTPETTWYPDPNPNVGSNAAIG